MNIPALLEYGNSEFQKSIQGIPDSAWETPGVSGTWSAKDVLGHVATMEHLVENVLAGFGEGGPTPYLDQYFALGPDPFGEAQVAANKARSREALLADYNETQARVIALVQQIPPEIMGRAGTLPWYGSIYGLDDYIVYTGYGHKIEHIVQLVIFRDKFKSQ